MTRVEPFTRRSGCAARPDLGGLVHGDLGAALEAVEDAQGRELRQRQGMDSGGRGDLELLQGFGVQAGSLDRSAGTCGHGVDPLQPGVAGGDACKPGRTFVGEAVQDVGLVQHVPVPFLLLRSALEVGIAGVVRGEPLGRKELGLIEDGHGGIYGADELNKLSFERDSDGDGGFSRHSVHHTEWRLGY